MALHMVVGFLIEEVGKYPEIYNPDNEHFSNKEMRDDTFNTISRKVYGIPGKILQTKWDQILNKYADFIRKLSNDDSSEEVLEQFMKWPWAKEMRNFKPYVRRQFQIPEFQPAIQLTTEINMDIPSSSEFPLSRSTEQGPALQGDGNEGPSNENETPVIPRSKASQFVHSVPEPIFDDSSSGDEIITIPKCDLGFLSSFLMEGTDALPSRPATQEEIELFGKNLAQQYLDDLHRLKKKIIKMGQFPETPTSSDIEDDSVDDDTSDDNMEPLMAARDDGPSCSKKRCLEDQSGSNKNVNKSDEVCTKVNGNTSHTGDDECDSQADALPDLPQSKPVIKKGPFDYTAQEHIFLAWAKTMSTFTAKRQATVKMQINKIMSEAEFEDLDDEFFAAKKEPYRPIYTSRY